MLLFFRMGDFFELFERDAERASRILNLTLTSRHGIPMCGVPHHAASNYLERLIHAGEKVAICDQIEDPAEAKGIVKRAVTRVITPGTLMDDHLLRTEKNNNLMACVSGKNGSAVAVCDISTAEFFYISTGDWKDGFIPAEICRYSPRELLLPEGLVDGLKVEPGVFLSLVPDWVADQDLAAQALKEHFNLISLDVFGFEEGDPGIGAAALVLHYLKETQKGVLDNLTRITRHEQERYMSLPRATQLNLELVRNFSGGDEHTLYSVLNKTATPMGARLLRYSILNPLKEPTEINSRLDLVTCFYSDRNFLDAVRACFTGIRDLQRLISRISTSRANARDLLALGSSLEGVMALRRRLLGKPEFLDLREGVVEFTELIALIRDSICDEPPLSLHEGGMIREGWNPDLDELRLISKDSRNCIAALQASEQEKTGISSLKVKYNKVIGYFIEVSRSNLSNVPANYERKQTLVNGERFIVPELKEYEEKVLTARERIVALEEQLFEEIREKAAGWLEPVMQAAAAVGTTDMLSCFAVLALERGYCCPEITDDDVLLIREGRHPVVEQASDEPFIPNDTELDRKERRIMIVTGPNMAGKSTYLRQTALITLMAQIGSYVPAVEARIGVVDKIFTRVGANDNIARGQSTFLVEMLETAGILNSATGRSLLIMDEIGRGTSTYDGLAIAWSVIEFLHGNPGRGGRTLFATHYHELTVLGKETGIGNLNVEVKEWNDQVIFLKKVVRGSADQSYGIHVARLAGMPEEVITRARELLRDLEEKSEEMGHDHIRKSHNSQTELQLPLFRPYEQEILVRIRQLDLNYINPMEAHLLLAEFKEKLQDSLFR